MSDENKPIKSIVLSANDRGLIIPKTNEEFYQYASDVLRSQMVPKGYKTISQVFIGLQYAAALGLMPTVNNLKNITVINGQPSIWGELPLELCRKSGLLEVFNEYAITEKYEPISLANKNLHVDPFAWICEVKRKGEELKQFWRTKKQLDQGIQGVAEIWRKYYDIMAKRKVRTIALKDTFTEVLGAVDVAEYHHDRAPDLERDVTPKKIRGTQVVDEFNSQWENPAEEALHGNA